MLDDVGKKDMDISELTQLYQQADRSDFDILSEMRSNVLLCSGDQYTKRNARFWTRVRDNQHLTEEMRIRLTKNHLGKIVKIYANNIMSFAPGVAIMPKQPSDLHDQKAAELHKSVMEDARECQGVDEIICEAASDFCEIGELHFYVYWDPRKGPLKGYAPELNEFGEHELDEQGQPTPDKSQPIHMGELCIEKIYGFNIRRAPDAESFDESPYLILNRMAQIRDLKKLYANDKEKLSFIQPSNQRTFRVFDAITGVYRPSEPTEILLRYFFFRPGIDLPKGYFYLTTEAGILEEGELPFGEFPIVSGVFERVPTTPRGRSPVKQLRPYQAEINRVASKIAEHQITLGDDKLILQGGAKVSSGVSIPGIRVIQVAGAPPTILPGRAGDQYVGYMQSQIAEMYQVADIDLDVEDPKQVDPYTMLFKSASQRKKFVRYSKRFERCIIKMWQLYLRLAKLYFTDDMIIRAVGKREQINIAEFKSYDDLSYEIIVEAGNDDVETKLGKQIMLTQALQYTGSQLSPDMIGQLLRQMPYANSEEMFSDLTLDYDTARNVMLALERKEFGPLTAPNQYDNHPYMIKKLTSRMRQADFKFLDPVIQQAYSQTVQMHMQAEAQKQQQIQMQEAQMIPTSGAMVKADLYVNDPRDPSKVVRMSVPEDAIKWLMQKLQLQGVNTQEQAQLPQGAQAQIAAMSMQPQQQMQPPQPPQM